MQLTRRCLAVLAEFRQAVTIITKNRLVTRDIDLLGELAQHGGGGLRLDHVAGPGADRPAGAADVAPSGRLEAIAALAEAGIPAGVMVAPVIPGLTEHEIPAIVKAAAQAGARSAGYMIVRLPLAVAGLVRRLAGASLPRPEGQGSGPDSCSARRPAQRRPVRCPDERRGTSCRADHAGCSSPPPAAPGSTKSLAGLARGFPTAGIGTT